MILLNKCQANIFTDLPLKFFLGIHDPTIKEKRFRKSFEWYVTICIKKENRNDPAETFFRSLELYVINIIFGWYLGDKLIKKYYSPLNAYNKITIFYPSLIITLYSLF